MKLYELRNVKKYYSDYLALDIPLLTLEREKLYIIYGPNASGKTTLLNLLAFLDKPTYGKVFFYPVRNCVQTVGKNISNGVDKNPTFCLQENILRHRVTLFMQNPYLFKTTVLENVISGLAFRSISRTRAKEKVAPVMKQMGIWELRNRYVNSLSGGEKRKVALARTIVLDTEVVLLDEPTSHIDRAHVGLIEDIISQATHNTKKTIIMTTHDLNQAHRLTSNIIYLINGRLRDLPLWNVFSAHLTESNNICITGNEVSKGVKKAQINQKAEIFVATDKTGPAKIVIDPKDILLSHKPIYSSALNNLKTRIVGIREVSGLVDIVVESGIRLHALITHKSFRDMRLNIGDEIFIAFKASAVEVFDA